VRRRLAVASLKALMLAGCEAAGAQLFDGDRRASAPEPPSTGRASPCGPLGDRPPSPVTPARPVFDTRSQLGA